MVIAHSISPFLFQTGNWIYNQLLFPQRCRHIVLTTEKTNLDEFPFRPIYSIEDVPEPRRFFERAFRRGLNQYLPYWHHACRNEKVDLLHSHFGWAGVIDIPLAKKLKVPHVVSFYGADIRHAVGPGGAVREEYRHMFGAVACLFVEGPHAAGTLSSLGCPEEKLRISHLGVNLGAIKPVNRSWLTGEPFRILMAGTFTQKKGALISLKAIEKTLHRNPHVRFRVSVVGDARNKAEEQKAKREILDFVNSTPLRQVTALHGYIPYRQLLSLAETHHLLMQTSIHAKDGDCEGGFPVIITDMLASGMPVLASTHCDIPEIIRDGKNGKLAREGDVDHTAEGLSDILTNYAAYRSEWFSFNRGFLSQYFDAKTCAAEREQVYLSLIKHP
jgi:colanic acid/amylovoran biosynthesis glycosyltransferase